MLVRFIASLVKLAFASLAIGVMLSAVNITTVQILGYFGMTPESLIELLGRGFDWALPKMFLGALFVVPTWFLLNFLRPPAGYE